LGELGHNAQSYFSPAGRGREGTVFHPLPENVYLVYMQYWKDTEFEI
jgi:hypothetical protein